MPELPEVEVVKESLSRTITGKKIKKVSIKNRNLRFKIKNGFETRLQSKSIKKVKRFSKYIILVLNDEKFCLIHLGMSGTIHLLRKNILNQTTNASFYHSPYLPKKHNHVFLEFDNIKIIYNDPRRFGYFKLLENRDSLENFVNNIPWVHLDIAGTAWGVKTIEYHPNNIDNHTEHKKIMSKFIEISSLRHMNFETIVNAKKRHKLKFANINSYKVQSNEVLNQLEQLKSLYKEGVLTEEEFNKAKKKILE